LVLAACADPAPSAPLGRQPSSVMITASPACIGQPCGEPCLVCGRDDPECLQAELWFCDAEGECRPPPVTCDPLEPDTVAKVAASM
jgi:hypothetical protein